MDLWLGRLLLTHPGMISQELGEAFVGKGMIQQRHDGRKGAGHHIRAYFSAFQNVERVTDRGGQYLGGKPIVVGNEPDVRHQLEPVGSHVVSPSDEWRNTACSRLGGKQRLSGGNATGTAG